MNILRVVLTEIATCYITVTLTATSLAKLRTWRASSRSVIREQVIPRYLAAATVLGISAVELVLATTLMLWPARALPSWTAGCLFFCFGSYRLAVAIKTKTLMCSCAGSADWSPASPQAIAATLLASIGQVCAAAISAYSPSYDGRLLMRLPVMAAWVLPFLAMLIGSLRDAPRDPGPRASSASQAVAS